MLVKLRRKDPVRELGPVQINVIVVPGVGTTAPLQWQDESRFWLEDVFDDHAPEAQSWVYQYVSASTGSTVIQELLDEGAAFLEVLVDLVGSENGKERPVFFICHSLGGFILKQALCIARNSWFEYRNVVEVLSGIIFLGSPHPTTDIRQVSGVLDLIARASQKAKSRCTALDEDYEALLEVCKNFELAVNLQIPILSVYETRKTQINRSVFAKLQKGSEVIVVPKTLATLNTRHEKVVAADSNHLDICNVDVGSILYDEISRLIRKVNATAPQRVADNFKPGIRIPTGLELEDLRSQSTNNRAKSENQPSIEKTLTIPIRSVNPSPTGGTAGTDLSFEMVPISVSFELARTDPQLPCFSLRPHQQNDDSFPREDILREIDMYLLNSSPKLDTLEVTEATSLQKLRSYAICGMGGMGKTSVAIQYAHSRKHHFDAVFWVRADEPSILAENFAGIAKLLNLDQPGETVDLNASRERVKGWLENSVRSYNPTYPADNEARWLLIFDNLENTSDLDAYWPSTGHGSILVTSRDPEAKYDTFQANNGMDLQPLKKEASMAFLQSRTNLRVNESQNSALEQVVERLGGLPYALDQMAGLMKHHRMSYNNFLELYEREGIQQLVKMQPNSSEPGTNQSFITVWALERLSETTMGLLQILALLDPDRIPELIFVEGCLPFSVGGCPKSYKEYVVAKGELLQTSLIYQNQELSQLSLHRLLQDTTKSMMNQPRYFEILKASLRMVSAVWPFQSLRERHSIARFERCAALLPCVRRLKNNLEVELKKKNGFVPESSAAKLMNDAGWYLFERGSAEECMSFNKLGQSICEQSENIPSEDVQYDLRESHNNQSSAAAETNDPSTSLIHAKIWLDLMLKRKSFDKRLIEDYELGIVYNENGVAYAMNNMWEDAASCFIRSIEIFQGLPTYEDTMMGWPEPNLGIVYWIQGKWDDAERVLTEILKIHADAYGFDDTKSFKTGKILYALGNVLESQERYAESRDFHSRGLQQYITTLGNNHFRTADICHRVAGHCMRAQLYDEAEKYLAQALKVFSARSHFQQSFARTTFRQGILFGKMGKDKESAEAISTAYRLLQTFVPQEGRLIDDLSEADFDDIVTFWSR